MKTAWKGVAAFVLLAAGPWMTATAGADPAALHLALKSSSPAADEILAESPASITLLFTEAPQMSGTSVRVLPKGGEPLDLGAAKAKEGDGATVVLAIPTALADGDYRVMWRAMADDGHTVRGDFGFTVVARR